MPQEQVSSQSSSMNQNETFEQQTAQAQNDLGEQAASLDSLLDDIESTLETNAEEYVSSFVQKGGE